MRVVSMKVKKAEGNERGKSAHFKGSDSACERINGANGESRSKHGESNGVDGDASSFQGLKRNNIRSESRGDYTGGAMLKSHRSLNILRLVAISFASVAGGPYGLEEIIGSGGVWAGLICLVVAPLIWSVPMTLMTAELSCMMPENGGHILWVERAFGSFWSYQNGYWSLFCVIFEGAAFPVLFMDYISSASGIDFRPSVRMMLCAAVILFVVGINIYGAETVAHSSMLFSLAGLSPFIIMIIMGYSQLNLGAAMDVPRDRDINWGTLITITLWGTSGYDSLGALAGEVQNPGTTFPLALGMTMTFTSLLDICSLAVGVSLIGNYDGWTDGTFAEVARALGGHWYATLFTVCASISVVGLLCTLLMVASRIMYGMSSVGTLPAIFSITDIKYGTPWVSMLVSAMLMALFTFLPFTALAEVEMWFYAMSTVLKFGSLVRLRQTEPDAHRPFRIPIYTETGMWSFVAIPIMCCVFLLAHCDTLSHILGIIGITIPLAAFFFNSYNGGPEKLRSPIDFSVLGDV